MVRSRNKASYLADMEVGCVRHAFELLTANKKDYIIYENNKIVDVTEAVKKYQATKDDKWVMHILASNLGYFANCLGKVVNRYNIDPRDYVWAVYEGLKESMMRCDANRARISYLSYGVFMYCRRLAEKEMRIRKYEVELLENDYPGGVDYDLEGTTNVDIDMIMAIQGIYVVSFNDEDTQQNYY